MRLLAVVATGLTAGAAVRLWIAPPPRPVRAGLRGRATRALTRWAEREQQWLAQAGVRVSPPGFWAASVGVGLVCAAILTALSGGVAVALVPSVAAAAGPRALCARRRVRRLRAVQEAWPDGLRELVAGVTAGMSLPQALCALATSGPPALREAFARFPVLARLIGTGGALEVLRAGLADPTSDRVLEVLALAHERGGALVPDILRDLADATTADVRALEEIATQSLEQKLNARAVFALPWVALLLLTARPGHFRDFYQSAAGLVVVAVAAALSLAGAAVIGRLAREPVEPRVFGGPPGPVRSPAEWGTS